MTSGHSIEQTLSKLKQLLNHWSPMPDSEWQVFATLWKPYVAKRKTILTASGEAERYLYFVTEGVQRVFYQDEKGREATLVFTYADSFGGILDSMLSQTASKYNYETLTNSSFIRAPYSDIVDLARTSRVLNEFIQQNLIITLSGLLARLVELQCYSSEEKFRTMLKRSPHILQLVPHKYLANYLGIDASNFSKFINRIAI